MTQYWLITQLSKKIAYKSKVESEDSWVKKLAVSSMADPEYLAMVVHIELGTEVGGIPKECKLSNMQSNYKDLSTVTLNGGKTLMLKHNSEVMVPKLKRANINALVTKFDPCQGYHRSLAKERVEVSHAHGFL